MGLKDYTISFVLVGIVVLLIFTFAYDLQTANNVDNNILQDNQTATFKGDVGVYLDTYSGESGEIKDIYYNTTLKEGTDSLYVPSQNTIQTKSWKTPFLIVQRSMQYAYVTLFGGRGQEFSYIFDVVIAIITVTGIFFFIKYIRQGQE